MPTAERDRRPLVLLFTANVISVTGSMLTIVAVPWFVLQTTGSAAHAGLVAFASTLPVVVAALLAGPLIDRLGQAVSSAVSDTVCTAAVGAIPVLHMAGALSYGTLLGLVAVAGLFQGPGQTAREVLVPRLATVAGTTVARASSGYESCFRGARMVGAPLAGLLIATVGAADALLVDAASFAVSALLIGFGVRGHDAPSAKPSGQPAQGYREQLREGYAYLLRTRLLLAIVTMVMVTNALDQSWSAVLLPVDAREHLGGATAIGLVSGATGAGALAGSLLYGVYGQRLPRRGLYIGAFVVAGFPRTALAALVPGLPPLVTVTALCGVAAGVLNPIIGTEMVRLVPERLRSRVFGAVASGCFAAIPLGGLAAGYLVQYAGLRASLVAVSATYLVTTLSPLVLPAFRHWDAPVPEEADGADGADGADTASDTAVGEPA